MADNFKIRHSNINDAPLILSFIKQLAEFEKLSHEVVATEASIRQTLFDQDPKAEVIIGELDGKPVTFALFFHNYSTFLGKPGLYLEDLFVKPEARGLGIGKKMLTYLAHLAETRDCGRFEWWVLDWNEDAIGFYKKLGAKPMDEWTVFRVTGDALKQLSTEHTK